MEVILWEIVKHKPLLSTALLDAVSRGNDNMLFLCIQRSFAGQWRYGRLLARDHKWISHLANDYASVSSF